MLEKGKKIQICDVNGSERVKVGEIFTILSFKYDEEFNSYEIILKELVEFEFESLPWCGTVNLDFIIL